MSSPSGAAGSSSGLSSEPPDKIARITLDDDTNNESVVTAARDQQEYDPLDDDDILESSSQRWQATEEFSALLNVCFVKSLSGFYKRQIVRSCPRPDVDCVYTPVLDKFLPDLVPKCKSEDKVLRKTQDLLLDVAGPIAMSHVLCRFCFVFFLCPMRWFVSQGKRSAAGSFHAIELPDKIIATSW